MKLLHLLLVGAVLAALARCATLRQYSRDWLISGETSLHKEPKRITAKSVFIAPDFQAIRCAQGYREDANGNCVKLVRVSQSAQLDFLLQRLNAMYGSAEAPGPLPFGGAKPGLPSDQHGPVATKPLIDSSGQRPPYGFPKPQGFPDTPGKGDDAHQGQKDGVQPPKAEPCIELPVGEDVSMLSSTTMTPTTTEASTTTERATSLSSAETLSVAASVQVVSSTSALPATEVMVEAMTEGSAEKDPEVLLVDGDSDSMPLSVNKVNGTGVVIKEQIPVLDGDDVMGVVDKTSGVVNSSAEVNDKDLVNLGDTVQTVKAEEATVKSTTEVHKVESSTKVSVPVNPLEKDIIVEFAGETVTTSTSETTTAVDEVEDTSTEDYDGEMLVEPEMGSGEREGMGDPDNVSQDNLFSETANADLDAMLEQNNSSQVDKVLPVRNIIPEAISDRIHFIDSPIINIQPVRNTFPGGDEIVEIDLKPNDNNHGAKLQVHNLNPSKLVPPKFMEEPKKPIPDTPFSLDDYLNRQPVPPIPVYRPYENLNFNPQHQHFPLQYQQPTYPPRNGFVRFPNERDQVYQPDQRVNSVRFPPGEPFNDEQLRQWPSNWRPDNRRLQRPPVPPLMRFWNKMPLIRNVEEPNQRHQHDRRRPPPQYYQ